MLAWCALACWLASWFLPVLDDTRVGRLPCGDRRPFRDPFPTRGEVPSHNS
jgi:hypothetical protein